MIVAVAGGTGGVGKTIVEKLVQESRFKIIVLSRSVCGLEQRMISNPILNGFQEPRQDIVLQKAQHVQLDYGDIASMTTELEHHNIHTIISAIGLVSDESSQSQLNLIDAAENAKCTERFIPSEYSFIQTAEYAPTELQHELEDHINWFIRQSLLPVDPSIQYWLDAANRLKLSSLKYTRVIPGFFMDYWGMPHVKTNLQPYTFGINIAKGKAAIPGDGNDVICMTYTADMATYMAKLLNLDEWSEFTIIVGDEVTYNQLISMSEEICG